MTLIAHPAAELFPMLAEEALRELANDIEANGLLDPLVVFEGKVLDGRNRQEACSIAGVEPKTVVWVDPGCGPTSWVLSKNLHRRQLTKSQAAAVAVEAEALFAIEAKERQVEAGRVHGLGQEVEQKVAQVRAPQSRTQAGDLLGVNRQYVSDAKKLRETAPETYEKVKAGTVTIQDAKREVKKQQKENQLKAAARDRALQKQSDADCKSDAENERDAQILASVIEYAPTAEFVTANHSLSSEAKQTIKDLPDTAVQADSQGRASLLRSASNYKAVADAIAGFLGESNV